MLKRWSLVLLFAAFAVAQPKRLLFVTHSAGFRHDSILVARQVLPQLDPARLSVTSTEDLSFLTAERLRDFDAVFFFTSGELPISDQQKRDLLDYVRSGKGFGGAHSATDTLYSWEPYGDLIGGYFDGHPWVQRVRIDVEDPENPIARHLGSSFEILEEIYQHRSFDRDKVRVLMTLDTASISLNEPGVNRTDNDFALAWTREYGAGRVFYTALGHFDETWRDPRVQEMLRNAFLWMTRQIDAPATPRGGPSTQAPKIATLVEAAQFTSPGEVAPSTFFTIFGENLSTGATMADSSKDRLAGSRVTWNSIALPVWFASPGQVNVFVPPSITAGETADLVVTAGVRSASVRVRSVTTAPGIFAISAQSNAIILWCGGLGPTNGQGLLLETPVVTVANTHANVFYAGLAPGFTGLYQVNVARPVGASGTVDVEITVAGRSAKRSTQLP